MDFDKLPDEAQKGLIFLELMEHNFIDYDSVLEYSKIPIYSLNPIEMPISDDMKTLLDTFIWLIVSRYLISFSFTDDQPVMNGLKPLYFIITSDFDKIDIREKEYIKLIDIQKDLNFLFN